MTQYNTLTLWFILWLLTILHRSWPNTFRKFDLQGGPQKCPYFSLAITLLPKKNIGNRMARGYWFDAKWVCPIGQKWVCPHFSNRTFEYLSHNFLWDRLISHQTDNLCPSYSQDLTPPDNFLRGYLKDRVCENNPQTREDIVRREIRWIPQKMLNRVVDNFHVWVAAVLSYSSAVHGTSIVLITEKV